jgi:hypothetical protein
MISVMAPGVRIATETAPAGIACASVEIALPYAATAFRQREWADAAGLWRTFCGSRSRWRHGWWLAACESAVTSGRQGVDEGCELSAACCGPAPPR